MLHNARSMIRNNGYNSVYIQALGEAKKHRIWDQSPKVNRSRRDLGDARSNLAKLGRDYSDDRKP